MKGCGLDGEQACEDRMEMGVELAERYGDAEGRGEKVVRPVEINGVYQNGNCEKFQRTGWRCVVCKDGHGAHRDEDELEHAVLG